MRNSISRFKRNTVRLRFDCTTVRNTCASCSHHCLLYSVLANVKAYVGTSAYVTCFQASPALHYFSTFCKYCQSKLKNTWNWGTRCTTIYFLSHIGFGHLTLLHCHSRSKVPSSSFILPNNAVFIYLNLTTNVNSWLSQNWLTFLSMVDTYVHGDDRSQIQSLVLIWGETVGINWNTMPCEWHNYLYSSSFLLRMSASFHCLFFSWFSCFPIL